MSTKGKHHVAGGDRGKHVEKTLRRSAFAHKAGAAQLQSLGRRDRIIGAAIDDDFGRIGLARQSAQHLARMQRRQLPTDDGDRKSLQPRGVEKLLAVVYFQNEVEAAIVRDQRLEPCENQRTLVGRSRHRPGNAVQRRDLRFPF